jgi:5'-nucleotidase
MKIRRLAIVFGIVVGGLVACSSSEDSTNIPQPSVVETEAPVTEVPATDAPVAEAPTTTVAPEPLHILVTNDDGIGADGIDVIVQALLLLDNVEVTVVAPLENQSGSGGSTSTGALTVTDATTQSGYAAQAVAGFPADTIVWAIDQKGIDFVPDLVVSGINNGQNYSLEIVSASGTVGAARAAAQRNIPSIAVSQGFADSPDYPTAADAVVKWIEDHRAELIARTDSDIVTEFVNINAPSCASSLTVRGIIEVPIESLGTSDYNANDCASTIEPTGDVSGFQNGYVTITKLPVSGAPFSE